MLEQSGPRRAQHDRPLPRVGLGSVHSQSIGARFGRCRLDHSAFLFVAKRWSRAHARDLRVVRLVWAPRVSYVGNRGKKRTVAVSADELRLTNTTPLTGNTINYVLKRSTSIASSNTTTFALDRPRSALAGRGHLSKSLRVLHRET
jgi:hypothetical protein